MNNLKLLFILISIVLAVRCTNLIVKPPDNDRNMADFEDAWKRIDDVYPFLELKGINWDSLYEIYRQKASEARGDEINRVLGDLLAELKDGHVYYKTNGGDEIYPYYPQRHFKDRHAYSPIVIRSYFDRELKVTGSGSAEYGITPENIGYVFLSDFHENYLMNEFPGIMQFLSSTQGLIIDIRQKRGGSYDNVLAVVSQFITVPFEKPKLYSLGEFIQQHPLQPAGEISPYIKPVVVLINGSTFSAGEVVTEMLKQLPNVTAIGDTTGGGGVASSITNDPKAVGEYMLPSGKIIYIGTGYIERYDGLSFEWIGVSPDIRVEQTESDIANGTDKQFEYALTMLYQSRK
ncbi:MAG: hypothetical protein KBA26_09360 [Candidatus Delongbacteria bacterium]|nr:hypothetical protein [Candidatus Delongbacteria bacterium]